MKKTGQFLTVLLCAVVLAGCGSEKTAENRLTSQNAVEKALMAGVESANGEQKSEDETKDRNSGEVLDTEGTGDGNRQENAEALEENSDETSVDIDLTAMSSDMVYATVYQIMVTPEAYVGKTIKMKGSYYAAWYEPTEKYYHYVLIADAAACCSQGIEFIWGDGEHVFPDEYPDYYAEVEVVGTFITYTEPDDPSLYCALKDATMKLAAF